MILGSVSVYESRFSKSNARRCSGVGVVVTTNVGASSWPRVHGIECLLADGASESHHAYAGDPGQCRSQRPAGREAALNAAASEDKETIFIEAPDHGYLPSGTKAGKGDQRARNIEASSG